MEKYWWYKTEWHQQMVKGLQVNGKGERTQEAYIRTMRQLVEFYDKTPDLMTEDDLYRYFIHRKTVTGWSPATMRICYSGIKFFFLHVPDDVGSVPGRRQLTSSLSFGDPARYYMQPNALSSKMKTPFSETRKWGPWVLIQGSSPRR